MSDYLLRPRATCSQLCKFLDFFSHYVDATLIGRIELQNTTTIHVPVGKQNKTKGKDRVE